MAENRINAVDDSGWKLEPEGHQNWRQEWQADKQTKQDAKSRHPVTDEPINPPMSPPRPEPPLRNGIGLQHSGQGIIRFRLVS